ncbi:NADP-dependent succinic semialdehyde dehydrogenase [Streptomyces tanashiensis]
MRAAATLLDEDTDDIARTMTTEMGKPIAASRAEAAKCAKAMRWYAKHAEELLADEHPAESDVQDSGADVARVHYRPLGPILAVMPWNFPLWQVIRFAAPALMAGNTGLLKHASNVPRTALYLGDLFRRAGYPDGCFQTLLIGSREVEGVLRDPRVVAATLTGSEPAGRAVAAVAGDEVKKTVLELGGSDPYIVMPSADIVGAVNARRHRARAEQRAVLHRRQAVHRPPGRVRRLLGALHRRHERPHRRRPPRRVHRRRPPGHRAGPRRPGGPRRRRRGAGCHRPCGGHRPEEPALRNGWYYRPTVLTGITPEMRIHQEEAFGPVATVYPVSDIEEAVAVANDSPFGLSSNVWTRSADDVAFFVRDLEAGGVFVNGMTASHPALPFGGIKRSGYGRELSGHGIREFCNATTVWQRA